MIRIFLCLSTLNRFTHWLRSQQQLGCDSWLSSSLLLTLIETINMLSNSQARSSDFNYGAVPAIHLVFLVRKFLTYTLLFRANSLRGLSPAQCAFCLACLSSILPWNVGKRKSNKQLTWCNSCHRVRGQAILLIQLDHCLMDGMALKLRVWFHFSVWNLWIHCWWMRAHCRWLSSAAVHGLQTPISGYQWFSLMT